MQEYVCADGRMSVNGMCSTPNQDNNITKDFSKDVKSSFQWDFDKVGNKVKSFGSTMKSNINSYDQYIEDNIGISTGVSKGLRAGSAISGAVNYGALGAVAPFLIPLLAGGALNSRQKKENERITQATMKDPQGGDTTIDMMTYGIPTPGQTGFNPHNDAYDNRSNNGGYNDGDGGSYSGQGEEANWGGGE